jgi:hypothetical protein
MAKGMREKLAKVIANNKGRGGRNVPDQKEPRCAAAKNKPAAATCSPGKKREAVTSVGS